MSDQVSTIDEVRAKALENAFEEPELVTMPSGLKFMLRRPKPIWWVLARGQLPQGIGLQAEGRQVGTLTAEEVQTVIPVTVRMIQEIFVEPKIKMGAPLEGPELNPNLIGDADFAFILKYTGGEVGADGADLTAFRGQSRTVTAGDGSGPVEVPAESDSGTDRDAGLAD